MLCVHLTRDEEKRKLPLVLPREFRSFLSVEFDSDINISYCVEAEKQSDG
jgi:hypothetical protein